MKKQEMTLRRLVSILLLLAMAFGTGCSVHAVSETAYAVRPIRLISEYSEETGTARVSDETGMPTNTEEPIETGESSQAVAYDPQPTTTEEVQAWIDAANTAYQDALASDGFLAAITAMKGAKPHWQYAVEANFMPEGYHCAFVTEDEGFGADYYTFFLGAAVAFTGSGGSGTPEDPYKISKLDDLVELRTAVNGGDNFANAYFVLTATITLSGTWAPIGTDSRPFSGTLSGNYNGTNYSITGLATSFGNYQGLFAFTENATIENLSITTTAAGINGTNHIGGLVGYASNTTIKNCRVVGKVTGATGSFNHLVSGTGGLVGTAEASVIIGCEATGIAVSGYYNTGGLLGLARTGVTVEDCSATGTVTATLGNYAGGLVGAAETSVITGCNTTDIDVKGGHNNNIGGLLGLARTGMTVEDCSATGTVTGTGTYVGGLIGAAESSTITGCDTTAITVNGGHNIGGLIGYVRTGVTVEGCSATGTVNSGGHYVGGLVGEAEESVIRGCETIDIIVNGNHDHYIGGLLGIARAGMTVEDCSATGTVTGTGTYVGGLVGAAEASTITGCETTDITVKGSHNIGGLLGYALTDVTVEDCSARGTVTATGDHVGGLIGQVYILNIRTGSVAVTNSEEDVEVTSSAHKVGGLIGRIYMYGTLINNYEITVKNCRALGPVTGSGNLSSYVGGLIGTIEADTAGGITTIQNCHASGDVTSGHQYAGGLISWAYGNAFIDGCSASGDVTGGSEDVGGLIGLTNGFLAARHGVVIKNSYATGDVTASGSLAYQTGGFIGDCHQFTKITNCYATGNIYTTYTYSSSLLNYAGVGGFVGIISLGGTSFTNCYALGRVNGNGRNLGAGSFVGRIYSSTHGIGFTNCYATGTVMVAGTGSIFGGFIGCINSSHNATLTNCFFDTTMTGTPTGIGSGSTPAGSPTGIDTKTMIDMDTFSVWGVKDNFEGKSAETGTDESPWYIDDDITYPYLYYQYDGHTKEETNYNIIVAAWNNAVAIYDRTDFNASVIPGFTGSGQFTVENIGADRMYFPYATDKNKFGSAGATITMPSAPISSTAYGKYSLGSASATDIVAFINRPGAVKTSDREDYEDASGHVYGTGDTPDGVTDTYVGDTVTYDITITHYSAVVEDTAYEYLHTWRDVAVSDPLADNVSFVEGSVTIRYNGETAITAEEGTGQNQYSYDEGERTLNVFLEDMEPEDQVVVTFQLFVEKEAVGKSVRNTGTVSGTFKSDITDETKEHVYKNKFDDKNDDPVKDAYKVTYDGNGGAKTDGSTKKSYYYHVSTTTPPTYTVLDNRHEDLGFVWSGHAFIGWNTEADGNGTPYKGDGSEVLTLTDDMTLYAQWEEKTIDFRFLKVDAKTYDETEGLPGAKFKLYICTDDATGGTHTHDNTYGGPTDCWQQVGDEETSSDGTGGMTKGLVAFTDLASGTYLLVETAVPGGYELPQGQWILAMDATATTGAVTFVKILNSNNIPAIVTAPEAEIDLLVGNIEQYKLPGAGFGGYTWFTAAGALLLVGGGVWLLWFRHRKRTVNQCKRL